MSDDNMVKHDNPQDKGDRIFDHTPSNGQGETESTTARSLGDNTIDEAAKYLAKERQYPPLTPEREEKLRRKIDSWMIPLVRFSSISQTPYQYDHKANGGKLPPSYFSQPLLELSTKWSCQPQPCMDSKPTTTWRGSNIAGLGA